MWQKIVELILKKYLEGKTPKRRAAKAFVQLYNSMVSCHETYLKFDKANDEASFAEWQIAVHALANNLLNLRIPLHIYDPDIYENILEYLQTEQLVVPGRRIKTIKEQALEIGKKVSGGKVPDLWAAPRSFERFIKESTETKEDKASFEKAASDLRQFIKNNFSLEDILDT